jgi:hypothetical protein
MNHQAQSSFFSLLLRNDSSRFNTISSSVLKANAESGFRGLEIHTAGRYCIIML